MLNSRRLNNLIPFLLLLAVPVLFVLTPLLRPLGRVLPLQIILGDKIGLSRIDQHFLPLGLPRQHLLTQFLHHPRQIHQLLQVNAVDSGETFVELRDLEGSAFVQGDGAKVDKHRHAEEVQERQLGCGELWGQGFYQAVQEDVVPDNHALLEAELA